MANLERDKRFKENPFTANMVIPVRGQQVRISRFGQERNVLINQSTGEQFGTHVVTYKRVDSSQFVKLFTDNIALTFDLTSAGIKAFNVLLWAVQSNAKNADFINLGSLVREEFIAVHPNKEFSQRTFARGLTELVKNKIIANAYIPGFYFSNPNFVFNGDRIAFTTLIEKKTPLTSKNEIKPLRVEHADGTVDDKTGDLFNCEG